MTSDISSLRTRWTSQKLNVKVNAAAGVNLHSPHNESYEEKCERRHKKWELLRDRKNVTLCRSVQRSWNTTQADNLNLSPRQQEFLKRRNLSMDDEDKKAVETSSKSIKQQENRNSVTSVYSQGSGPKWYDRSSVATNQDISSFRNRTQFTYKHPSREFKDNSSFILSYGLPQGEVITKGTTKRDRGTQTPAEDKMKSKPTQKDSSQQTNCGVAILDKEIIQLSEYLKEALHREVMLKQKLAILQQLLTTLLQASEKSWKAQMTEEALKGKLKTLETQLTVCTQNCTKDSIKKTVLQMEEEKLKYEQLAKESLHRVIEEKTTAEQKLQNIQRSLTVTEQEGNHWKESYEKLKEEWSELNTKEAELTNELHMLQNKLQRVEAQALQVQTLQSRLDFLECEREELKSRTEVLGEDNELKQMQLCAMRDKLKTAEGQKLTMESKIGYLQNVIQTQALKLAERQEVMQQKEPIKSTGIQNSQLAAQEERVLMKDQFQQREKKLKDQLEEMALQLTAKEKECTELRLELEALSDEYHSCQTKLRQCREELNQFQRKRSQRRCGCCMPLLVLFIATAIAAFYINIENLINWQSG
ncbi:TRAF3-interacting JNK-activating modulator [Latimeria chalumnae]|uniref:TRAF3-interacting JNK-activating modulator n=1 Tax=Latimeria chalumnae TaxID=7897 RepID=UPI0003C178BC|nr:PREDICTED: TRAF3-interacting JNK-activating modulator [Latimeria chalumnae]|eukprot:XP_005987756.1 PREDICTED: TRAF3-interacting JNK-activating modulator [Latimeria chalumnae]